MAKFNRAHAWTGQTLALSVFRQQFTELNAQYWGGVPAEILVQRVVANNAPASSFQQTLGDSSRNWAQVANDVQEFESKFKKSRDWSRLTTVILLTSCFVQYLVSVARASIASDPFLRKGFPKKVDGLMLLKYDFSAASRSIEKIANGTWKSRSKTYKSPFGDVPIELSRAEGELDRIRKLRNSVAHQFGLDESVIAPNIGASQKIVSESQLLNWFALIDRVVAAVDFHLRTEFIGDFETLLLFHRWKSDSRSLLNETGVKIETRLIGDITGFRKFVGLAIGQSPGTNYCRDIRKFYGSL